MKKLFLFLLFLFFNSSISFATLEKETLIILDQSASMLESYQGESKINLAIDAVRDILSNIPDDEYVGLRTVGVHPLMMFNLIAQNKNALCEATALLNEIQPNNKQAISNSLNGIIPSGASPLHYTLELAINDDFLTSTNLKHIIIVTDGYENCDGNPCMYIRRIALMRKDIKIDVVAIGATGADVDNLSCLTDATSGNVYNVQDARQITTTVNTMMANTPSIQSQQFNTQNNYPQYNSPSYSQQTYKPKILKKSYLLEFFE